MHKADTNIDSNSQLNEVTADSSTLSYFNKIKRQQKLIRSDDAQMLSIADSLFTEDELNQGLYFLVFTKSMNGADGFYSEMVSKSALEYLTTRTDQFIQNFRSIHELNDLDFDNWAVYVYSEIQLNNEGHELEEVNKLEKVLLERVKDKSTSDKKVIELFIASIKSTAHNKM